MRALIALIILMGACAACASQILGAPRGATPIQQYESVVQVTVACPDPNAVGVKPIQEGSGFVVSATRVVTALHVVHCDSGTPAIWVDPGDGVPRLSVVEVEVPDRDLARLRVSADMSQYRAPMVVGPVPEVGDEVCWSVVAPVMHRRCGRVTPAHTTGKIWVTGTVIHGMSGGPLFDSLGRVVGVIQAALNCPGAGYCLGEAEPLDGLGWLME